MELTELKNKIINSFDGSKNDLADMLTLIDKDEAIFPFNEYEHLICALINKGNMTYEQYLEIRAEYVSENPFIWVVVFRDEIFLWIQQKEKLTDMRILKKLMTRVISLGNIRFKTSTKDFNRLRIGVINPGCADHVKRYNRRHAPHAQRSRKTIHRLNSGIDEFAKRTHKPAR